MFNRLVAQKSTFNNNQVVKEGKFGKTLSFLNYGSKNFFAKLFFNLQASVEIFSFAKLQYAGPFKFLSPWLAFFQALSQKIYHHQSRTKCVRIQFFAASCDDHCTLDLHTYIFLKTDRPTLKDRLQYAIMHTFVSSWSCLHGTFQGYFAIVEALILFNYIPLLPCRKASFVIQLTFYN